MWTFTYNFLLCVCVCVCVFFVRNLCEVVAGPKAKQKQKMVKVLMFLASDEMVKFTELQIVSDILNLLV